MVFNRRETGHTPCTSCRCCMFVEFRRTQSRLSTRCTTGFFRHSEISHNNRRRRSRHWSEAGPRHRAWTFGTWAVDRAKQRRVAAAFAGRRRCSRSRRTWVRIELEQRRETRSTKAFDSRPHANHYGGRTATATTERHCRRRWRDIQRNWHPADRPSPAVRHQTSARHHAVSEWDIQQRKNPAVSHCKSERCHGSAATHLRRGGIFK